MKFNILNSKNFNNGKFWLLTELSLFDYVNSLTEDNFNFEVQRKIVKNKYLDGILSTIEAGEPLPNITLAYHKKVNINTESKTIILEQDKIDILDGLQRTYRLWAFWKIYNDIKTNKYEDLKIAVKNIRQKFPDFFENGIVDAKFFKQNFEDGKTKVDYEEKYKSYNLYFTIWTNLTETELVKKMLILNAGHKAVSTQHQFEILFLNLWKSLKDNNKNITIIREKESQFNQVKRGNRNPGEYLFSTIITSLMSLVLAKPQRISSDIIYKYDLIDEKEQGGSLKFAEIIFNSGFISELLNKIYLLDKKINSEYGELGTSWFGKDTTLNGIFAGVGSYLDINEDEDTSELTIKILITFDILIENFSSKLELEKFNSQYDNLSGRSVNIGNLIRTVIMNYTVKVLNKETTSWNTLFNQQMKK
ncbi:hypothetical protein [Flavobacterium beibuense]|uniref:DUF262 domain-containing protein n=1 Tax=Flavobacterium beibuense TaxID=657326 RepID=A0A444W951_9FLAO|nr:hypothetical protein [Flavobacterium beibuense]RYJ42156.1 hypothetical protein NU09_2560 [Flavobacterium beibuense]